MSKLSKPIDVSTIDQRAFWLILPVWKASEAAALLLDLDPDIKHSTTEYLRLLKILKRARKAGLLGDSPGPADFLEFAKANRLPIATAVAESVSQIKPVKNWRAKYFSMKKKRNELAKQVDDNLSTRERTTALTLIAVLCRLRNEGPDKVDALRKKVVDIATTRGLKTSASSVGLWFKEADEVYAEADRRIQ